LPARKLQIVHLSEYKKAQTRWILFY